MSKKTVVELYNLAEDLVRGKDSPLKGLTHAEIVVVGGLLQHLTTAMVAINAVEVNSQLQQESVEDARHIPVS